MQTIFRLLIVSLAAAALIVPSIAISSQLPIGKVKTAKGEVLVVHDGQESPMAVGDKFYQNDIIKTGKESSVGVILEDNTVLSLGSQSEIAIDEYVFSPEKGKLSMIASMIKGTASYLSGIIGRQSPESVKINTPDATIGIRGTKFLVKVDGTNKVKK